MLRFIFSTIGGLVTFLMLGGLMGVVAIGALFYVYGRDLPDQSTLAAYAPQTISRIYSREGQIVDEFARQRRLFTPIQEIPPLLQFAFVSAEDKNFFDHPGFDPRGIAIAAFEALRSRGRDIRGASTITQQVMKNIYLSGELTAERKIQELILAARAEQVLSKGEILEIYLNEIALGFRSFGVTAAAQTYFNKTLDELTPGEMAYLASLPKAPSARHPVNQYDTAIFWRNFVLREMFENGYIDRETMQTEQDAPLRTVQSGDYESFRSTLPERDFYSDEIRRQLSSSFGEDQFFTGGLSIRSSMDEQLQVSAAHALQGALERFDRDQAEWRGTGETIPIEELETEEQWRAALARADVARDITLENPWFPAVVLDIEDQRLRLGIEGVEERLEPRWVPRDDIAWMRGDFFENFEIGDVVHTRRMTADSDGTFIRWSLRQVPEVQGAFMAMDVNTGRVLAMQGGFSYQHSNFNRATLAQRQPGSAFKPFVYAAALDSGYTPATIVVDGPIEINTPQGIWRPQNASNQYYGPTPLRTGIEQSRNLMTIRLAQEVGMGTVAGYAERFGVYEDMQQGLASSLGSDETTLFRMVAAYSMFANGGERVEPTLVDRVQDRYGNTVYRHDQSTCTDCSLVRLRPGEAPNVDTNRSRIMNEVTAYQLTSMMEGVVLRGTARGINLPVPIAGKTGTTNDAKDVWFVGFSSNIAAGCFIGYDTPRSLGRRASGGGICGPVFEEFMWDATAIYGGGDFNVPQNCRFITIDRISGARLPDGVSGGNAVAECFREGEEPVFGITFDGGFVVAGDLPLFDEVRQTRQVENSSGGTAQVGPRATFNTLSSGGLY